jgi:seryl-tRNA synthetase
LQKKYEEKLGLIGKARYRADRANTEINALQKQIAVLMKSGKKEEAQPLLQQKDNLAQERININKLADEKEKAMFKKLNTIGNIVHDSVPDSLTEDDNAITRSWWPEGRAEDAERERRIKLVGGATVKEGAKGVPGLYSHHEVLDMVNGFDTQRGTSFRSGS